MTTRAELRGERTPAPKRRRRRRRAWIWGSIGGVLLVLLVGGGLIAWNIADRALGVKSDLEQAMPLVSQVQSAVLSGETEKAKPLVEEIERLTSSAAERSNGWLWTNLEWVPLAGPNLAAVRIAATATHDVVTDTLVPASTLSLSSLAPKDGAFDLTELQRLSDMLTTAEQSIAQAQGELNSIDRRALIPQVVGALDQLDGALDKITPYIEPAQNVLSILPNALGANGPRNYLLLFQNNAESRGTGGNPAALALIRVEAGRISIVQQASSSDFFVAPGETVMPLDDETVNLYGKRVAQWVQDVTVTPDFEQTGALAKAFWAHEFGTRVDAVASFDPVALSYLLDATGPVKLPFGGELTSKNAVPRLLSEVYSEFPDPQQQDLFFAAAAGSIFDALTNGKIDPKKLVSAIVKAADEGRLLYAPADDAEREIIKGTRVASKFPTDNSESTVTGVYVDDVTEGKLDYYAQLSITARSNQCSADETMSFTTEAVFANTLRTDQVRSLPVYVSPGRFFPKGTIATQLAFYGPKGTTLGEVLVDGKPARKVISGSHLGRPAVIVPIENDPETSSTVSVTFTGPKANPKDPSTAYGPLDVWHTPMVKNTPVKIETPGCTG